jgi:stress response protein SCP2
MVDFGISNQRQAGLSLGGMQQPSSPPPPVSSSAPKVILAKGQKVSLSKMNSALDQVLVGLGWDKNQYANVNHDLDVEVFLLGTDGRVLNDDYFVFYNHLVSADGSVRHSGDNRTGAGSGDDETVQVCLSQVNPQVQRIVFVVTINEALARGHNFSQIQNAFIRVVDNSNQQELVRFNITEAAPTAISMIKGEIYRHNGEWKFNPVGEGVNEDLIGLCHRFGVNV